MASQHETNHTKFFWIDLEMTGLDENIHHILEVAVIVTDLDFNVLEEYETAVYQPKEILDLMDDWCTKTHTGNGLVKRVATGKPLAEVEKDLLAISKKHFLADERIVLSGNSVNNDKRFIDKYLKNFAKRLHYRLIDVSSFKEIFRDKYGVKIKKGDKHRALDDIKESITELKAYLAYVTVPKSSS